GFEIDLFWAKASGSDPARLIASLPGRVPLMHIKDMKKDLSLPAGSSGAPEDSDVAAGTGQLDFPAIFKAAIASMMEYYFIEDESTKPWDKLPVTLGYLRGRKLYASRRRIHRSALRRKGRPRHRREPRDR